MGLSALSTHSAGRRRSRPGESPFISALMGAVRSAIFAGCLYTTSGQVGPKSRRRTRDGGFIYALSADENSLALAAFALQAQPVFLPFQMQLPSRRQRHFHGDTDSAYNTLHFATQSRVPKGALPPLDSPTTKRRYATLPGA